RNASLPKRRIRARSCSDSHATRDGSIEAGRNAQNHSETDAQGGASGVGGTKPAGGARFIDLPTSTGLNTMSSSYRHSVAMVDQSESRTGKSLRKAQARGTSAARPHVSDLLVSSAHLVSEKSGELSEFEFGLIIAGHAFNRWVVRCMAAAGIKDLTTLDVLLLHHVNHRAREKKLGDISFMLNIADAHVVSYSLKKFVSLGVVQSETRGKEVVFFTTAKGHDYRNRYPQ